MPKNLEMIDEFKEKYQENENENKNKYDLIDEQNPLIRDVFSCQANGIIEKFSPSNFNIFLAFFYFNCADLLPINSKRSRSLESDDPFQTDKTRDYILNYLNQTKTVLIDQIPKIIYTQLVDKVPSYFKF